MPATPVATARNVIKDKTLADKFASSPLLPAKSQDPTSDRSSGGHDPTLEHRGGESIARTLEPLQAPGVDAVGIEVALRDVLVIHPRLLEGEDVVHADDVPFHADDLGDLDDLPRTAGEPGGLHDDLQRRGDLAADDPDRQVEPGHAHHHLQPADRVAGVVGVD